MVVLLPVRAWRYASGLGLPSKLLLLLLGQPRGIRLLNEARLPI